MLDIKLIILTILSFLNKKTALKLIYKDLSSENKTFKYNNQYGDIEIDLDLLKSILI